jgi:hypothetical protein
MIDRPEWDGGAKVGPYLMGKRYRGVVSKGLGRIYQAHHMETGAPALVVMPGPPRDWRPNGGWSVRARSEGFFPPFLALEVEQAPRDEPWAMQELGNLLQRLGASVARLEEQPEAGAREHLLGPPRKPEHRFIRDHRPGLLMSIWACAMAALAGTAVMLWPRPPEPSEAKHAPPLAAAALTEPILWLDQGYEPPLVIGYPPLEAPLLGQRKPPCELPSVELRGHCWVQLAHNWPCPRGSALHEGRCYLPVSERKPVPGVLLPCAAPAPLTRGTCC